MSMKEKYLNTFLYSHSRNPIVRKETNGKGCRQSTKLYTDNLSSSDSSQCNGREKMRRRKKEI
jgi:hypothetical protein